MHELRGPSVSHDWLKTLNPARGARLSDAHFLTAFKLRVGFRIVDEPMLCPECGVAIRDRACTHALCCASAESTKGNNNVRDSSLQLVSLADAAADKEVPEPTPSAPTLRPADIFTLAAVPGCQGGLGCWDRSPRCDRGGSGLLRGYVPEKAPHTRAVLGGARAAAHPAHPLGLLDLLASVPGGFSDATCIAQRAAKVWCRTVAFRVRQ